MSDDLQPDTGEILQEEAPDEYTSVPVCVTEVKTPVRVQELPRKGGATRTVTATVTPRRYLTADHRRAWAKLRTCEVAGTVAYAFSEASAQDLTTMSELPGLESETLDATTELWVRAIAGTARISITTSNWAEGE